VESIKNDVSVKKTQKKVMIIIILLITVFILYNVFMLIITNVNRQIYSVTVTDKLRVTYGHIWNQHKYLIFTEDEYGIIRVFENTDSLIYSKFNSSDVYAQLKVGSKVKLTTVGVRIPERSMYQNIINVEFID